MPVVNGKKFPYTEAGKLAAKKAAATPKGANPDKKPVVPKKASASVPLSRREPKGAKPGKKPTVPRKKSDVSIGTGKNGMYW